MSQPEIDARVKAAAESLDLAQLLDRYPAELSGGQQQRVAIGRAIVRQPKVFLFDEPFSNLDAALRHKMRAEVKELHVRLGVTSIFVTHDQEEALSISDRIAILRKGVVEQYGTPEEIYVAPATTYVARFIGNPQVEILPAHLDGGDCLIGTARLKLTTRQADALARHAGDFDVAIRPEHVTLGQDGVPATIRIAQPVGPSTVVTFDWEGGSAYARLNGIARLQPGMQVRAAIDPNHLMFFDRAGGRRIELPA
jgi:ABC-type sugar transport system ATPase subunit